MSQPPPFLEPTENHAGLEPPPGPPPPVPVTTDQPSTVATSIGWGTVVSGAAICLGAVFGPLLVRLAQRAMGFVEQGPGLQGTYATPLRWSAFYERHMWWFVMAQLALGVGIVLLGWAWLNRRRWAHPALVGVVTLAWVGGLWYVQAVASAQPNIADPVFERLTSFGRVVNIVIVTALYAGLLFALTRRTVREGFRRPEAL